MLYSNSNLLTYISTLLQDDGALKRFVVDPITDAEGKYCLTKAERAVLRRVVSGLSNKSVNGFSMERTLDSYRRSLRLLQNVLHNTGTKMSAAMHSNVSQLATGSSPQVYHLVINYPTVAGHAADFTCKKNSDVNAVGGPYAHNQGFQIVFDDAGETTVERLLLGASQAFPSLVSYQTVPGTGGKLYVKEITINGESITADLSNPCYDLGANPNADSVFWFFSVNGKPGTGQTGGVGGSFQDYVLKSGDTVYWQLIAPDASYGFQPCAPHAMNEYATAK